jgi:hypothetical protein
MIIYRRIDLKFARYFAIIIFLLICIVPVAKADIWQATYNVKFLSDGSDSLLLTPIHIIFKARFNSKSQWTTISDQVVKIGQTTFNFSTEQYTDTMFKISNPAGWFASNVTISSPKSPTQTCVNNQDNTELICLNILAAGSKNQTIQWRFQHTSTTIPLPSTIPTPTIIACPNNSTVSSCDNNYGHCAWFACANNGNGGCFDVGTSMNVACPSPTPGPWADANGDGVVDDKDYLILQSHFLENGPGLSSIGDFSHDGKVNGIDYIIWMKNAKK